MSGTFVFAGGGSGGHVFPLLAVAEAVRVLSPDCRVLFVGTDRGMEKKLVPAAGFPLELIEASPMRGNGLKGVFDGALAAGAAVPSCLAILRRERPAVVLSAGGYAAGPLALAARLLGIPLALVEPNAEIGLSNRLIAPLAARAYIAFPRAKRHFRARAIVETGVPIRSGFEPSPYVRTPGLLRVLVFGGSQGAKVLNECVPRALSQLRTTVSVVHQCGGKGEASTRALYDELGLTNSARVATFLDDMPAAIASADVVIGRAGAGTVSEICAVGRASLLIPYPFAGDHQRWNARPLAERGAAISVSSAEATPERLARELARLHGDPGLLERMAHSAQQLGRPYAAQRIALDLLALAGLSGTSATRAAGRRDFAEVN